MCVARRRPKTAQAPVQPTATGGTNSSPIRCARHITASFTRRDRDRSHTSGEEHINTHHTTRFASRDVTTTMHGSEGTTTTTTRGGSSRRRRIATASLALVAGAMCASRAHAAQSVQDTATAGLERFQLHGSGTTNPSKLFWYAMDLLEERAKSSVRMTYRSIGSGSGATDWGDANAGDFASTDYGLNGADYLQVPFQIGAIGVFHTIPGFESGALKLSACTIAKIYTGEIKTWDHGDIKSDSGVSLPAETIKVVFRSDGSSSTYGLKGYLNDGCPEVWTGGVSGASFSSVLSGDQYLSAQGSDGVRATIAKSAYSIGYLDAGHGHADDLKEFALKNKDGEWLVTATGNPSGITSASIPTVVTTAIQDAYVSAGFSGDLQGSSYNLFNKAGTGVWPICAFTYMHVRKQYVSGETAALVRAFVKFILSDEIQAVVNRFYFFPLDKTFRDKVQTAALAGISLSGSEAGATAATDWTFEVSTIASTAISMDTKTFSAKRHSYVDYALELLEADVTDLQESVTKLNAESSPSLTPVTALAAFDFVMAFIALVVGSLAFYKARNSNNGRGIMTNYIVGP